MNTDSLVYSNLLQAHMLDSNTFSFMFYEVTVPQDNAYYTIVFSDDGEIKFSATQIDDVTFDKYNNELSFKITKIKLTSIVEEICNYINNYNQNDVIEESYTYKYSNNKMNLEDLETITIGDISIIYCK